MLEASGLTVAQLVDVLKKYGQANTEMLFRQYLCGGKIIGAEKMRNLALIAWSEGWRWECVREALAAESAGMYELYAGKVEVLESLFLDILSPSSMGYELADLNRLIAVSKASAVNKARKIYEQAQDEEPIYTEEYIQENYLITNSAAIPKPKLG